MRYLYKINKNKYYNKNIILPNGDIFKTKKQYERWIELLSLQKSSIITKLDRDVSFELIKKSKHGNRVVYDADFFYIKDGKKIVEDCNSNHIRRMPMHKLKKRLFNEKYSKYGIELTDV